MRNITWKALALGLFMTLSSNITLAAPITGTFQLFETPGADGYVDWLDPANVAVYNDWLNSFCETPEYGEDWDGNDWQGNPWANKKIFDVQDEPGAIFADGVTFANAGSTKYARAEDNPGKTDAIGGFAWRGHESGESTMYFSDSGADYLGFWVFETGSGANISYNIEFSDGSIFSMPGEGAGVDRYRFVGLYNTSPGDVSFSRFWIDAPNSAKYGIDEVEWGSVSASPLAVPAPSAVWLMVSGLLALFGNRLSGYYYA